MKERKTLIFLKIFALLLLISIPSGSFAMYEDEDGVIGSSFAHVTGNFKESKDEINVISTIDELDTFKIKFATQKMRVRTISNEYVDSTWEEATPNQGLAEESIIKGCNIDPQGMCCSHAVVCALEYCHNRSDLLASYLHKAVTGGYENGMNLEDAMNFVEKKGIMALPEEQTVQHGSGLPWPEGERYKFTQVINADIPCCSSFQHSYPDKASQYKAILKYYNHPIVVSILSGYEGHRDQSPFLKYRGADKEDIVSDNTIAIQDISASLNVKKIYHAVILYGYRESTKRFFIKNSWGPYNKNGLCTLPYEYIDKFARAAFVGLGHDDWQGEGLYGLEVAVREHAQICKARKTRMCIIS